VLEVLREPLESDASRSRARRGSGVSRAFQFVAAMNPCRAAISAITAASAMHAGPGRAVSRQDLRTAARPHRHPDRVSPSRRKTCCARHRGNRARPCASASSARTGAVRSPGQAERELAAREVDRHCAPMPRRTLLKQAIVRLNLSARAYPVLKLARTIADSQAWTLSRRHTSPRPFSTVGSTARRPRARVSGGLLPVDPKQQYLPLPPVSDAGLDTRADRISTQEETATT